MSSIKIIYFIALLLGTFHAFSDSIKTLASINEINSSYEFPSIIYVDTTDLESELIDE